MKRKIEMKRVSPILAMTLLYGLKHRQSMSLAESKANTNERVKCNAENFAFGLYWVI